jgi:aminopeptidase N
VDDDAKMVYGTATHRLSPINDGLREVVLDQGDLTIHSVKDEAGKALEWETFGQQLTIRLLRARKAGKAFEIRIRYLCSPRTGLFFVSPDKDYPNKPRIVWTHGEEMDNRSWFPSYDYPNQKFTTEILVTVADKYKAISNGHLLSERHDARRHTRTFHWLQDKPHPNYLVAFVVGEWDVKEWDADGVPVQAYVPKGMGKYIDLCFSRVPAMVEFFGRVTGLKFPWDKYAQACVPEFTPVGMENTSITILYEYCLTDEKAYPDYSSDGLLSHELAHQWFGDWLTCKSWGHLWLNESFADYFECLWHEEHYGKDEFLIHLEDLRQEYYEEASKYYKRPIVTHKFVAVADMFDKHTYNKGCGVLHMMRNVLGDDLWWKGIRRYVAKHAASNVETNDLKVAIEEATGRNLDWFFEEWLYKAGHPEFEVSWSWDEKARLIELRFKQNQEVKDDVPLFRMPVVLELATEDRVWRETVQVERAEHTYHIVSPNRPKMVLFDPDGALLKKVTFKKEKEELLWQIVHAKTAWGRIEAAQGLGCFIGDEGALKILEKAFGKEKFWGVRRYIAEALGKIGTPAARDVLLRFVDDKESRVRRAVFKALGEFRKDDKAFQALKKAYLEEEKYHPAATAALALAETRHDEAFETIVRGMDRPSQAEVVARSATDAIADLREARGIQVLKARTAYGRPELVRSSAAAALGRLGFYHEQRRDEILDTLALLLRDSNSSTRLGAIDGLSALGYRRAEAELEKVQDGDVNGAMRRAARRATRDLREKSKDLAKRFEQQDELDRLKDKDRELESRLATLEAEITRLGKRKARQPPRD